MELSGLQIFKYLPGSKKAENSNCKKCGFPTCMAFALNVAKKKTTIDKCEFAPNELIEKLESALKIQQNVISFGPNKNLKVGGETVMFRHDKTFVNKTIISITLESNDKDFSKKLDKIANYSLERIGEAYKVDAIYLKDTGDIEKSAKLVNEKGLGIILDNENEELKIYNPITITKGQTIEELAEKSLNKLKTGNKDILLSLDAESLNIQELIEKQTYIRRLAILNKEEAFGFPVMTEITEKNIYKATALASFLICRYSNIIAIPEFNEAMLTTILTLRQNIYTDPQKPLQVESKVYEVNEPDENAIVMMTTNFALTYFAVLSEVESSQFPTYIVITPSDGMSVLTAWSADKFTPEIAAKMIKESEILKKVKNKKIIIPGLLAHMKEELEEAIEDWEIIVGPNEAIQLPDFVKTMC